MVVPDVGALNMPGARAESGSRGGRGGEASSEGVRGLKSLGVRDLHYRMAFLACSVSSSRSKSLVGDGKADHAGGDEEPSPQVFLFFLSRASYQYIKSNDLNFPRPSRSA